MNVAYQKNIQALDKIHSELAAKVDALEVKADDFAVIPTKAGDDYTLQIEADGKERLVHSLYRPVRQAKKEINKLNLDYYNLIGVAGIGCGHYIRELLRRFNEESQLVIIENRLDILKEVMKHQDISDIFKLRNVQIFDGSSSGYTVKMRKWLKRIDYNALTAGNVDFFKTPVLKDIYKDDYKRFVEDFFTTLNYVATSLGNAPGDTLRGIKHGFKNVKYLLKNSLDFRKINYYNNKPAICVASGPSLDKNIDVLKRYQDKALIFSANTTLQKLLNYGIKPDIVSFLERHKQVYDYSIKDLIEEDKLSSEVTPVANGVVDPKIFNELSERIIPIFRDSVTTERWFVENIPEITGFDTGLSVANMNFAIAQILGCSPIILVGQDLAFAPDGRIHTEDTKYDKLGENEDEYEIVEVTDYNGEKIKSRKWWKIFKNWFEYKINETRTNCIDATEGGAYIKGTKVMTLQEVADEYLSEKIKPFHTFLKIGDEKDADDKAVKFKQQCLEKMSNFEEIEEDINSIMELIEESKEEIRELEETEELKLFAQKKFVEINTRIAKMSQSDQFFFFICQAPFVQLERYKVQMGDLMEDTKEKFIDFCNYDLDMLDAIKGICQTTIECFEEGIDNINEVIDN